MDDRRRVAIFGAGAIGTGFAATVVAAGWDVLLVDPSEAARDAAPESVARHIRALTSAGHRQAPRHGKLDTAAALDGTGFVLVIEAGPERRDAKEAIFRDLLETTADDTVLVTASSAIPMSAILPDPTDQARCLVAHPANPPSLIRVIELVPAPGTDPAVTRRATALFQAIGFDPVPLGKEIPAFVFNRLQSALLREAYRLVDEGVVDVDGIDRLVRDGLGPRWALSGPFETADLNTAGGVRGHAERLGPAYAQIGRDRGEHAPDWPAALVDLVEAQRRALLPEEELPARRAWRERALAQLLAARARVFEEGSQS
ncbi:3-hydroxyacyl-CoA dehydrogenase NAD-binding domain-containing protein [Cognatishimia sp. F0-27]|uniref:3-hydroxyacyl-CoA dehydrogenase NAD-binding domain-containing protein n=1 Tax=Cognatishimia sp. F0-27 TaxID=2816855 RepID=UPI001D0C7109|nr:3-hydroxyacyl-CoA dehydrogenase NAD-binding domain-containing protein [Cognatishimia sp. F0-27]MCC1493159.1 3-hydroxyacyl-CoA dehydrogenase [Cognatishimia sp. F0-27]